MILSGKSNNACVKYVISFDHYFDQDSLYQKTIFVAQDCAVIILSSAQMSKSKLNRSIKKVTFKLSQRNDCFSLQVFNFDFVGR